MIGVIVSFAVGLVLSMGLTPVVRGKGWAMYDNIRVSLYDGTDFAAGAPRTTKKIVVDGSLDDWDLSDPIPLLCDNQIKADAGYTWAPKNLAGKASFGWDEQDLAFDLVVEDSMIPAIIAAVASSRRKQPVRWHSLPIIERGRIS